MKNHNENLSIDHPRFNDEFYGYKRIENLFIKQINNKNLSNAYLFYGIKGLGKATFAFRLSRFLLMKKKENKFENLFVSKSDSTFKTIASLTHPDFNLIEKDKTTKKINTYLLQSILKDTYSTNLESEYKIIIIDSVDDISTNKAYNILLKLLEDCPSKCIFLLIAHSLSKIPSTLLSRCQKIYFNPLPKEKLKQWFSKTKQVNKNNINIILNLSNGSLGKAIDIINNQEYIEILNQSNNLIKNLNNLKINIMDDFFFLYNKNLNIIFFLLILQFSISDFIKNLSNEENQEEKINIYLSLYFEINKNINNFKVFNLDENQSLKIIKYTLLKHSNIN